MSLGSLKLQICNFTVFKLLNLLQKPKHSVVFYTLNSDYIFLDQSSTYSENSYVIIKFLQKNLEVLKKKVTRLESLIEKGLTSLNHR